MIERLPKKLLAIGVISALGLSACETYKIDENEFNVTGRIVKIGDRSINVEINEIGIVEGRAEEAIQIGDTVQIHDNCNKCGDGFLGGHKTTGSIYDYRENIVKLASIDLGSCVEVNGYMREYTSDNKSTYRPEFGVTQIVDC